MKGVSRAYVPDGEDADVARLRGGLEHALEGAGGGKEARILVDASEGAKGGMSIGRVGAA